jgi:phosphate transport system substrate-binding protein
VDTKTPLSIAGSTTVYEFSTVGAGYFEENYTQYKVSVQKGGSGAGKISAYQGIVDIGSSSSALSSTDMTSYPTLVQTLVAYDAIVLVVPSATTNTHGLVSMNETVLKAIYYKNGGATYTVPTWMPAGADGIYQWNEIPTTQGVAFNSTANVCTGTQNVKIYDRADHSGTEESFSKQMADTGKDTLEEVGIVTGNSYPSNQEIITKLAADNDGFGFMAYGLAKLSTNGLRMVPFAGDQGLVDPAASTFVSKVKVGNAAGGYDGARGLYYLTNGEPSGVALLYIDYVKTPDVNNAVCTQAGYISLYA